MKDRIIGKIKIDSVIYKVISDQRNFKAVNAQGYIDHFKSEIHINPNLDKKKMIKTLLHEIVHDWNTWRLGDVLEEQHCNQLSSAMFSLLYENECILDIIKQIKDEDDTEEVNDDSNGN
jgi:hypothetical protein